VRFKYTDVITRLNLASDPFRNRTTPYLLSAVIILITAITAVFGIAQIRRNTSDLEIVQRETATMKDEVARLLGEGEKVQQQLTPEQRSLLVASHRLVANKSFGWSRLFADLESVLPAGVSASRISIQNVFRDGDRVKADLECSLISRDYQSVMAMIGTMNNSGIFQAELRGQDLRRTERISYTVYTLRLVYSPPYGFSPAAAEVAKNETGGLGQ
jgi:Tfp pilus assembly protein PilN